MALRARRKRQGGSSYGRGRPDPSRPNVATGVGTTRPQRPTPVGPHKGTQVLPGGVGATGAPTMPSASFVRQPPPPPSMAIRGPSSEALRANAQSALGLANNQYRDAAFRAIMQLGDPTQFSRFQNDPRFSGYQFTQDPNSVFAQLARQEKQGLEDIDVGANQNNTYFSGMRLRDRGKLTDETARQRLAGSTAFEDALREYAAGLGGSENEYRQSMADADQMDIDAALEQDRINREIWAAQQAAPAPVKGGGTVMLGSPPSPSAGYLKRARKRQRRR